MPVSAAIALALLSGCRTRRCSPTVTPARIPLQNPALMHQERRLRPASARSAGPAAPSWAGHAWIRCRGPMPMGVSDPCEPRLGSRQGVRLADGDGHRASACPTQRGHQRGCSGTSSPPTSPSRAPSMCRQPWGALAGRGLHHLQSRVVPGRGACS
jgi:hypothetical protein